MIDIELSHVIQPEKYDLVCDKLKSLKLDQFGFYNPVGEDLNYLDSKQCYQFVKISWLDYGNTLFPLGVRLIYEPICSKDFEWITLNSFIPVEGSSDIENKII